MFGADERSFIIFISLREPLSLIPSIPIRVTADARPATDHQDEEDGLACC